jgi:hypothetical protein
LILAIGKADLLDLGQQSAFAEQAHRPHSLAQVSRHQCQAVQPVRDAAEDASQGFVHGQPEG